MVHDIAVTFDQAAYDAMVDAYVADQDKEWIEATVTIDGVTLQQVGMRLKGNSSLRSLARAGGAGPVGGMSNGVTEPSRSRCRGCIRFDKYVDGQTYQGRTDVVIRGNNTETSLNEAVALELIGLSGAATQKSFATRFRVNGGAEVLRLAIENPNDDWEDATFDGDGILYKAESTGDYSYRGTNPESYNEVFDQETDTDNQNLAPLMSFLDFINNSSDAAFAADLSKHLDVDAFARYLALQELVGNFDDIDGPGQQLLPPLRRRHQEVHRPVLGPEPGLQRAAPAAGWRGPAASAGGPPPAGGPSRRRLARRRGPADPAGAPTSWCSASRPTPPSPPCTTRPRPT